jgi:hypothetical protein
LRAGHVHVVGVTRQKKKKLMDKAAASPFAPIRPAFEGCLIASIRRSRHA